MSDPTPYVPGYSYSGWETVNPTKPKPGPQLDNDFANISQSLRMTIDALADVRRSDGKLQNGSVGADAISATLIAQIAEEAAAQVNVGIIPVLDTVYVERFGADPTGVKDSSDAFFQAAEYSRQFKTGRIYLNSGRYKVAGVPFGSNTIWTARNRGSTSIVLPDGANTFMFKTDGFDAWADSVPSTSAPVSNRRSYTWNSSPAARNAVAATNGYIVGSIVVTNPTNPGLDGSWGGSEQWWQATGVNPSSGFADQDIYWTPKPSLLGAISSGFDGITFEGNASNQGAAAMGLCVYGVGLYLNTIMTRNFGDWGAWLESPGGVFSSQVGVPLQTTWFDVRATNCGTATSGNIYDNSQSDSSRFLTLSYAPKNKGFCHYMGEKAGGARSYGFHYWVDDPTSNDANNWGLFSDAQACDWYGHCEQKSVITGARHTGEIKVYRGSSATRSPFPAITLRNPNSCKLSVRSYLFQYTYRISGSDNGYNFLQGQLAESIAGTAVVDTVFGAALSSTTFVLSQNGINASDNYYKVGGQVFGNQGGASPALADYANHGNGFGFTSQGPVIVNGGQTVALGTTTEFVAVKPDRSPSFTVATLPTASINNGARAFASDGRKASEGAGAGSGIPVYRSAGQWRTYRDDTVAAA